jgi:hypothetical protein
VQHKQPGSAVGEFPDIGTILGSAPRRENLVAAWNKDDTFWNFLTLSDGYHLPTIPDSSLRLPAPFDTGTLQSPGFNPVNFFARHPFRAEIGIRADKCTEFIFRLDNTEGNP